MTKSQRRRLDKSIETRTREIAIGISAARIVARATAHHLTPDYDNYVEDTKCARVHRDAGLRNFALQGDPSCPRSGTRTGHSLRL